jgi:hypothetical protein
MKLQHVFLFWRRETWRFFWRRPSVLVPATLTVVLLVVNWYVSAKYLTLDTVILRYSIYVGTNWLTPARWIFWLPLGGSLIAAVDIGLAYFIARNSLVLRYLLLWSAAFSAGGLLWLNWLLFRVNI